MELSQTLLGPVVEWAQSYRPLSALINLMRIQQISTPLTGQVEILAVNRTLKAIALIAYAGEINQHKAIAAGFQMHLTKPVEPNDLVMAAVNLV